MGLFECDQPYFVRAELQETIDPFYEKLQVILPYRMWYWKDGVRVCESGYRNMNTKEVVGTPTITIAEDQNPIPLLEKYGIKEIGQP